MPAQIVEDNELECSHSKTVFNSNTSFNIMSPAQKNYDVIFYDIDLDIRPDEEKVYGEVQIIATSLMDGLTEIEIDLASILEIESIKDIQDNNLNYTHSSDLISISLLQSANINDQFEIHIKYNGSPEATGLGSFGFDTHNGQPMIWSLSEPYGARSWWPCKDTPLDKADSVNISLTVPDGLIAASNGLLVDTESNAGKTTFHWQERYPIATYLVSIAIHPYTVFYDWYVTATDSMRLEYYVFPDRYDVVRSNYLLTNDMITAMVQRFGEYPFIEEKYGHAEFVWGGGMEHQTLSSLGGYSEGLIAHELGHQWWGDMVTCANFHHIWLNEGFATYSEALWYELRDNDIQSLHDEMNGNANYYFTYPDGRYGPYADSRIYVADTTRVYRIFDSALTYAKAAWVMHMLRHVVGDENFFEGIKEYGDRYRFKSAVTEQFQEVMEDVSGLDLNYFFQRWIYGELYPIYKVVYSQNNENLLIKLNQTQNSEVFEMPIDLRISYSDGTTTETVIHNTSKEEYFEIPIGSKIVTQIEIDPDNWILRKIESISLDTLNSDVVVEEFILYSLYPNPFNSDVNIKFYLPRESKININIFDLEGINIWKNKDSYNSGTHIVSWHGQDNDGNRVPSGTYLVEVSNDKLVKSSKVLLLK